MSMTNRRWKERAVIIYRKKMSQPGHVLLNEKYEFLHFIYILHLHFISMGQLRDAVESGQYSILDCHRSR